MAAVAESALALAKAFDLNVTAVAASTEAEAILLAAIQACPRL